MKNDTMKKSETRCICVSLNLNGEMYASLAQAIIIKHKICVNTIRLVSDLIEIVCRWGISLLIDGGKRAM